MAQPPILRPDLDTIVSLAETISRCARQLESSGASVGTPPSPPASPKTQQNIQGTERTELREACDKLLYLAAGPYEHLMATAQSHRVEAALQFAAHFDLASYVPSDGSSIAFSELAAATGLPTLQISRMFRILVVYHIFYEPRLGFVAHNACSRLLLEQHIHATVSYYTDESFRAASCLSETTRKWPGTQERNETALNLAYNTTLPKFEFFNAEPWRAARFRMAMAGMTQGESFSLQHLVQGFDWASLPEGSMVADIGGGGGHVSVALAKAHTKLNFIVQDLKTAFDGNSIPESLSGRISFREHNFFTTQPSSADVFLLRWILHDYPDKFARKILQNTVAAMKPGSRIVVMEGVMQPPGSQSHICERKSRLLDVAMMTLLNSSERDLDAWKSLFYEADPSLKLVKVTTPAASALSVMELQLDV
ncbi:hypothetical protein JX266_008859 [Neoarthrinium moseri]|nr:hypothetical protein JX266_008859 [Neoarthrinium moseri]